MDWNNNPRIDIEKRLKQKARRLITACQAEYSIKWKQLKSF